MTIPSSVTWPCSTRWSTTPTARSATCCPLPDGRLYGCDHGVCFGEEYKLRTVLWQWRGRRLPGRAMQALARLQEKMAGGDLAAELAALLSPAEVRATSDRIDLLIQHRVHPYPPENWPAVPWPPV